MYIDLLSISVCHLMNMSNFSNATLFPVRHSFYSTVDVNLIQYIGQAPVDPMALPQEFQSQIITFNIYLTVYRLISKVTPNNILNAKPIRFRGYEVKFSWESSFISGLTINMRLTYIDFKCFCKKIQSCYTCNRQHVFMCVCVQICKYYIIFESKSQATTKTIYILQLLLISLK